MNYVSLPLEPTEDMVKVLLSEGPFFYRLRYDDYAVLEKVGPTNDDVLLHVIVARPDSARDEARERNAKWKYDQLLRQARLTQLPAACSTDLFSSRCCELGTKSCTVKHTVHETGDSP